MDSINIIMTTYQGGRYIKEQIESLLNSDYQGFFLHIFDDGSSDETINIVKGYEQKYPNKIKVHVNSKNLGHVNNFLNALITLSASKSIKAEYYMFCDQDDVWKEDKISIFLKRMRNLEVNYGKAYPLLVFSDASVVDEELKVIYPSYHKSQRLNTDKLEISSILMENKCSGCMMMINKALASKVKKLPTNARYHDWWIALIAAAFGNISYINKPLILYRQHSQNVVGNQGRLIYLTDRITNIRNQKKALEAVQLQAEEFLTTYKGELDDKTVDIIKRFSCLSKVSWVNRRIIVLRYGYFKSTLLRNIGVMILL